MPEPYVASLGRISGKLLTDNLLRNGSNLTFRNGATDDDLLYLDVNNMRIGINTDAPLYDLHINSDVLTTDLSVTGQARIGNILINAAGSFGSYTGPINITPSGVDPIISIGKLKSDYLEIYNNRIGSITNSNIKLDPVGTGKVIIASNASLTGNLVVQGSGMGNIVMGGNLRSDGTITVGDNVLDTVTVNTDFTQSIIPGTDVTYDLGKSNKRWAELESPVWQQMDNIRPSAVRVSAQMLIDGVNNKISSIQSNEDISLFPETGIVYIENTKWQDDTITNLINTPLTFTTNGGIGYVKFVGTNALEIPAGDISTRPVAPEVGDTRWNTELGYLECFDGSVYVISIGSSSGGDVTLESMADLGNIWSLVLG